jgi:hypothetical protein
MTTSSGAPRSPIDPPGVPESHRAQGDRGTSELPEEARAEVRRILNAAARRLLDERLAREREPAKGGQGA